MCSSVAHNTHPTSVPYRGSRVQPRSERDKFHSTNRGFGLFSLCQGPTQPCGTVGCPIIEGIGPLGWCTAKIPSTRGGPWVTVLAPCHSRDRPCTSVYPLDAPFSFVCRHVESFQDRFKVRVREEGAVILFHCSADLPINRRSLAYYSCTKHSFCGRRVIRVGW